MLVPMKDMAVEAMRGGYAIPGFNYYNQASVDGIVEEAEALASPVILMVSGIYLESLGLELAVALARQAANRVKVPVSMHLDHGSSYELVESCIKAGFTSVMIDASHHTYAENIALTSRVVKIAQANGVTVEAELGAVGGVEDAVFDEGESGLELIDPEQAADFVDKTGIDLLAPAIGNVHGMTKQEPRLNLSLLAQVRAAVAVPLVLHGGSGISDETIKNIIKIGVSKINVGTELKIAWRNGLTAYFATGKYEPHMASNAAKASIRKTVGHKIGLCGSAGKV